MNWNDIAARHYDWVERMGWHNKTVLEALALIGSEIGEAAAECFEARPTGNYGEELADIVLRTVDLAKWQGIDIPAVVAAADVSWHSQEPLRQCAELMVDFKDWVNSARRETLGADFGQALGRVLKRVFEMAQGQGIDLEAQAYRKLVLNESRGTRGRRI